MTEIIVAAVVGLLLVVLLARGVFTVPQAQSAVIERNGRFHRVAEAGPHFRIPLVDHVRARIDLREQVGRGGRRDRRDRPASGALVSRRAIAQAVQNALGAETARWGISINSVELTIEPDEG